MTKSVLIADDNILTLQALKQTIPWQKLGYDLVFTAGNGEIGLKIIREKHPALVISDIKMPMMSGLKMIHLAGNVDMLVIFITGYQEFEWARQAIRLGAVDFILKPVDNDELIAAIKKAQQKNFKSSVESNDTFKTFGQELSFLVTNVLAYLQTHFCEDVSLQSIADMFYINASYLSNVIKKETGYNFSHILSDLRMEKAKQMLENSPASFKAVAYSCGFHDYAYFYQAFRKYAGITPGEYRKAHREPLGE